MLLCCSRMLFSLTVATGRLNRKKNGLRWLSLAGRGFMTLLGGTNWKSGAVRVVRGCCCGDGAPAAWWTGARRWGALRVAALQGLGLGA